MSDEKMPMRKWAEMMSEGFFMDDKSKSLPFLNGFDDCIVGVARRKSDVFVVYDQEKVIGKLMDRGMDVEAAHEVWDTDLSGWGGPNPVGFLMAPDESPQK